MDRRSGVEAMSRPRQLTAAATGLQAVGLLVLAAVDARDALSGAGSDAARGLTGAALFVVLAGGLAVLAVALRRGSASARTPLLVWNALLVPVVVSLVQSGQVTLAALVAATVVVAVVAGLMATPGRS
ncbi:MAG: hypothetical protein WAW82_02845 [Candidatus Lutibacillus vidarii]|nr:hypothetical protein [Candidatus Lutibacillus vidarii]